jgi:hypothetical protein
MISTTRTGALVAAAVAVAAGSFMLGAAGASDGASAPAASAKFGNPTTINPQTEGTAQVTCPQGTTVTGGGGTTTGVALLLNASFSNAPRTWKVSATNFSGADQDLRAFARCVTL